MFQKDWDSVVENPESLELSFVPLDHQIVIHPTPETTYSLCDCMLYQEAHWLALVELKDQAKGWLEDAIGQLKSTIKLIRENPKTSEYSLREAYAANRNAVLISKILSNTKSKRQMVLRKSANSKYLRTWTAD